MKKSISILSVSLAITFLIASCSKPQYGFFGGGPKRLTADVKKSTTAPSQVATSVPSEEVISSVNESVASLPEAQQALVKNYVATATASVNQKVAPSKITSIKEVFKLKREIKKLQKAEGKQKTQEKSQLVALLLAFFLGGLGIHRFYLGYTWQGVVQLLTGGGCGVWALIDFIRIIIGDLKPKGGAYDKTL